jgi:epoxyqueuosine reductase QueG
MQQEIINLLPNQNEYVIGFADMGTLLESNFPYRYAIVIGAKLNDLIVDGIEIAPTIEYLDHYNKINENLNEIVIKISKYLTAHNIENKHIPPTVKDSDLDEEYFITLRYKYSHKMAATCSGIGWIGKTDLLISHKFGPRLRLASVLTNHRFDNLGIAITESKCGNCTLCVDKCPANAANGMPWNTSIDRDEFFNAKRCRETCRSRSLKYINKEISLCGICVSVCPTGKNKTT